MINFEFDKEAVLLSFVHYTIEDMRNTIVLHFYLKVMLMVVLQNLEGNLLTRQPNFFGIIFRLNKQHKTQKTISQGFTLMICSHMNFMNNQSSSKFIWFPNLAYSFALSEFIYFL
jgi:hypothetical protein